MTGSKTESLEEQKERLILEAISKDCRKKSDIKDYAEMLGEKISRPTIDKHEPRLIKLGFATYNETFDKETGVPKGFVITDKGKSELQFLTAKFNNLKEANKAVPVAIPFYEHNYNSFAPSGTVMLDRAVPPNPASGGIKEKLMADSSLHPNQEQRIRAATLQYWRTIKEIDPKAVGATVQLVFPKEENK